MVSILFYKMPFQGPGQKYVGVALFFINVVLFILFTVITLIRFMKYRWLLGVLVSHPSESFYFGTIPMVCPLNVVLQHMQFANN